MPTNKEIYFDEMNALADSINTKAGLSGRKDISELKDAVDGITVGIDTSDATAYNSEILFGKTAYARGTKLTGTILSQPAQTITPTIAAQTIPAGWYLSGTQTVEGVVCTNLIPENIADGVTVKIGTATDDDSVALVVGTHQGGAQPQLNAPTISVSSSGNQSVISISNPATNGNFVEKYKIFLNDVLWTETTATSNIAITPLGNNTVTVKACGTDFEDSPASNAVTVNNYTITVTCVDCTADAGNPTVISNNGATATLVFTPDADLEIRSDSVVISGASVVSVDKATGTVVIGTATANVVMTVTALEIRAGAILTVTGLGGGDPLVDVVFTENEIAFDWNFQEVTIDGNIFIKIPTMYRKVNTVVDDQITSFSLADSKIDNDYQPYPCFLDSDGTTVLPYVLIGKYCSSSTSVINSVNDTPASQTLENGRTNARALGTGYQLYDWQIQKLFVDLAMMKAKTVNFQDGSATISEYLGIAHMDQGVWIDGIYRNNSMWYVARNPSNYASNPSTPTGYFLLSYSSPTADAEIKKLGYDINNPFVNYPWEVILNSSFSTYYCDGYYHGSGSHPIITVVGGAEARRGLWYCFSSYLWSQTSGVRLCYKPISA